MVSMEACCAAGQLRPTTTLSPAQLAAELDAMWTRTVEAELDFSSYVEFRRALPNPLSAVRR